MNDPAQQDSSYMDRLTAMGLLRENMFLDKPETYAMTDIAEDLPGNLRPLGQIMKNVLPSHAIISDDPEKRKAQIQGALDRIKAARGSKKDVLKEMGSNALHMGGASFLGGLPIAALFHLLSPRGMTPKGIMAGYLKNKGLVGKRQAVITPFRNLKKVFSNPKRLAAFAKKTTHDALTNAGIAATTGAALPLIAHSTQVSDKALDEARQVMEDQPYITSLPASEMLSVIKQKKEDKDSAESRLKNIGLGTGLGALTGAVGGLAPAAMNFGLAGLSRLVSKKPMSISKLMKQLKGDVVTGAKWGAGLGALGGATTKNYIADEYANLPHQRLNNLQDQPDVRQETTSYKI
jgi:hypothetical protein